MRGSSNDVLVAGTLDIGSDRVATILQMIKRGWGRTRTRPGIRAGVSEVELNECLRDGMREAVEPRVGGQRPRMLVAPGTESRSTPDTRVPDGRTDIPIYFLTVFESCHDHDPHAIIECKRVAGSDSDLCRRYVTDGIDRFVGGKYGGRHTVGFMAGYLESGTADLAARGINRYLTGQGRGGERLGPATGLTVDCARSSRHPRSKSTVPVEMHHLFLEFSPDIT